MAFRERIEVILGLDSSSFLGGMKAVRAEVAATEGFTNKLKVGVQGLGSTFSQAAQNPAVMATAIAGAGAAAFKFTSDAANLGVEIGQLADATGISTEAASRFKEALGDIGIESGTFEKSVGFMNKTLGNTPGLFTNAGISIHDTNGNLLSADKIFLNVIDRLHGIKDPAEQGALAAKLLGKSWQDMSEVIGQGAEEFTKKLNDVADVKVLSPEEVQKARDYREAMDRLGDAFGEMALTVGQELVPVLSEAAGWIAWIAEHGGDFGTTSASTEFDKNMKAIEKLRPQIQALGLDGEALFNQLDSGKTTIDELTKSVNDQYDAWEANSRNAHTAEQNIAQTAETARETRAAIDHTTISVDKLSDSMGVVSDAVSAAKDEFDAASDAIDGVGAAYDRVTGKFSAAESFKELADSAADLAAKQADGVAAQDELTKALEDYNDAVKHGSKDDRAKALEAVQAAQEHVTQAASDTADAFIKNGQLLADHAKALKNLPAELTTKILTDIDEGKFALAEAKIKALERTRYIMFEPIIHTPGGVNANQTGGAGFGAQKARAPRIQSAGAGGLSDLLSSGIGGVWTAPEVGTAVVDPALDAINTVNDAEIHAAQNQLARGKITLDQYLDLLHKKSQAADAQYGDESDQAVGLFLLVQQVEQQKADAVAAAEAAKQAAIQKTIDMMKAAETAAFDQAAADYNLTVASQKQAYAMQQLAYVQQLVNQGMEDQATLDQYVQAAADATFAGAKARALQAGLQQGTAEFATFVQNEIQTYLSQHPEAGAAFAAALTQDASAIPSFGVALNPSQQVGGFSDSQLSRLASTIEGAVIAGMSQSQVSVSASGITTIQRANARAAT